LSTGDTSSTSAAPGRCPASSTASIKRTSIQEGNLYVTEVSNDRSQKFRPRKDADAAQLIKPMVDARAHW
jgi:hypothetical protein